MPSMRQEAGFRGADLGLQPRVEVRDFGAHLADLRREPRVEVKPIVGDLLQRYRATAPRSAVAPAE